MATSYSSITIRCSPKRRLPRPDPYALFLAQLHNCPVVLDGMRGSVVFANGRVSFVPDSTAVLAPAYMTIAQQVCGGWNSLDITEDLAALGQVAQCVGLDYLMVALPLGVNAAVVAAEIEQVLFNHEWQ